MLLLGRRLDRTIVQPPSVSDVRAAKVPRHQCDGAHGSVPRGSGNGAHRDQHIARSGRFALRPARPAKLYRPERSPAHQRCPVTIILEVLVVCVAARYAQSQKPRDRVPQPALAHDPLRMRMMNAPHVLLLHHAGIERRYAVFVFGHRSSLEER